MGKCDIDDILCKMQVLGHLKSIDSLVGTEKFREEFPEFDGLGNSLAAKIQEQELDLRSTLEKCGLGGTEVEEVPDEP